MPAKGAVLPCLVCNPDDAQPGDYCDPHREELHRLDHQYETLFRIQRTSRGKDHETYNLFLQGECEPCGRVLVNETDPENLVLTLLITGKVDLETPIADYGALKVQRSYGDQLRERIQQEIVFSWYGNVRACIDIFVIGSQQPTHWDVAPREEGGEESEDEGSDPHSPQGGKHSVH